MIHELKENPMSGTHQTPSATESAVMLGAPTNSALDSVSSASAVAATETSKQVRSGAAPSAQSASGSTQQKMSFMEMFFLTSDFPVVSFHRSHEDTPLFAVREFDVKIIRHSPIDTKRENIAHLNRSSEQNIRVAIRQAILDLRLDSKKATKDEVRMLKEAKVLGKRAPSCSLLKGHEMCKLLRAFGQDKRAKELKVALSNYENGISLGDNTQRTRRSYVFVEPQPPAKRASKKNQLGLAALLLAADSIRTPPTNAKKMTAQEARAVHNLPPLDNPNLKKLKVESGTPVTMARSVSGNGFLASSFANISSSPPVQSSPVSVFGFSPNVTSTMSVPSANWAQSQ